MTIQKILFPLQFTDVFPRHIVHQAAWLARRFKAEIILLHVVTPFQLPSGMLEGGHQITARDLHAEVVQRAEQDLDQALIAEFDGIPVTRILLRGDPAREIVRTAREKDVGLIVMPAHDAGNFYRFLLGSVTAKVLHESHCPVWTGAHLEAEPAREFEIRNVLCAVDLNPHNRHTLSAAAAFATALDASLTLAHITASVEVLGPGEPYINTDWKEILVGIARDEIAKLQQELGTGAPVIIDSGNVPHLLNRAAEQSKADLLIVGRIPGRSHLGDNGNGYGIIRESHIPVLSV